MKTTIDLNENPPKRDMRGTLTEFLVNGFPWRTVQSSIVEFVFMIWQPFDCNVIETRPTATGRYFVCRKDGKIHMETWNGSGWAYNHNEIRFYAIIFNPITKKEHEY